MKNKTSYILTVIITVLIFPLQAMGQAYIGTIKIRLIILKLQVLFCTTRKKIRVHFLLDANYRVPQRIFQSKEMGTICHLF